MRESVGTSLDLDEMKAVERVGPRAPKGWLGIVIYTATFFILLQILLSYTIPVSFAYRNRMDYNIIKDNLADVGRTMDLVARYVKDRHLTDYVILIGDSILYSGPGGPEQSVSRFMNDRASSEGLPPVFNFAIPAAQMGDFYTVLLMLDERGISTNHVVLNLTYGGFVKRDPDPPIVYWLERDLKRLDPVAYNSVAAGLEASKENKSRPGPLELFLEYSVYSKIPVLKYRDFLRSYLERALGERSDETGDPRPWYEKAYLKSVLVGPVYERQYDPKPLELDDSNENVAFLKRIISHQQGKDLLFFMSPMNKEVAEDEVSTPGFKANMENLSRYLEDLAQANGQRFVNLTDAIPNDLFSDNLHLVASGYKMLGDLLWDELLPDIRANNAPNNALGGR